MKIDGTVGLTMHAPEVALRIRRSPHWVPYGSWTGLQAYHAYATAKYSVQQGERFPADQSNNVNDELVLNFVPGY